MNSSKQTIHLPKLRKGLTFAFNDYDIDGKPQWLIHDPGRNKFFIIGLLEFEILERWSLSEPEAIIEAVNNETTLYIDNNDIENLLRFLVHNYLIEQSGYQIYQKAKEQKLFKNDNLVNWIISYYLFFKIPLCHPDEFLTKTKKIGIWLFSRSLFYTMTVLAVIALYQLSTKWEEFTHTFSTIFTLKGLFFSFIAYSFCKLCHELGHAYKCKQYGVPVPSLGLAFLVFWPVLYTDTTLSWSLNNQQRMRIALAGITVETYITIIAALIWCNTTNITIQSICYVTITINWMASLLINVSPFMRFDGYYVLADYIKMPNLQPRAFALTRWQIRQWLFKWPDPPPERFTPRMHHFLVAYSLITWIYRLSVYIGIAFLVYHFFIKVIGILLFVVELFYFILSPFVHEVMEWITYKEKFRFNRHTRITLLVTILFLLFIILPTKTTVKLPGTLSYTHQFLFAPDDSMITSPLPPIGSTVTANVPIIKLDSPDINHSLKKAQLEYEQKVAELRRASIDQSYAMYKPILLSDINKAQAQYDKFMESYKKLTLTVPFNGIIIDIAEDLKPGSIIMKNEWIGDVIDPTQIEAEAFVSQMDLKSLHLGATGYFYPTNIGDSRVAVKLVSIEIINSPKLNCHYSTDLKQMKDESIVVDTPCYNVSDLGGEIPTYTTPEGDYVPVTSVFRVRFIPITATTIKKLERGTIVVKTKPISYLYKVFYQLKTGWIQQRDF